MDLTNIATTIDKLAVDFETALKEHKGTKNVSVTLDYFRKIVTPFAEKLSLQLEESKATASAVTPKKTRVPKKTAKSSDDEKSSTPRTWNQIFLTKEWGMKRRFPEDFERINEELKRDSTGKRITGLSVISKLRTELEAEEEKKRWLEYIKWVQENMENAPSEAPKERDIKKSKK